MIILDNKTYFLYLFYFVYILIINSILYFINYNSISNLDIKFLIIVYFVSSFMSLVIGLYYALYKFKYNIDLNKQITFTGKICLISFFII